MVDRRSVTLPDIVPDVRWVSADAVDEPLGVVVQAGVDSVGAAGLGAAGERVEDGRAAGDACAII